MKAFIAAAAVATLSLVLPASAREVCHHDPVCQAKRDHISVPEAKRRDSGGRNATAHAQACMAKNGFNLEMWTAHRAGTDEQVLSYIQCRDGVSRKTALATGRRDRNFSRGF